VTDEWLDSAPVQVGCWRERLAAAQRTRQKSTQNTPRARVDANQAPAIVDVGHQQVVGTDEFAGDDVDDGPIEHVVAQQHFPGPAFELAEVQAATR
jgi:hypothetical protein